MPRLNLSKVHNYVKVPGQSAVRLVGEDHYVRMSVKGQPPLYAQRGMVFSEGGPEVPFEEIPSWFWKEAKKVSKEIQEKTGLLELRKRRKAEKKAAKQSEPKQSEPKEAKPVTKKTRTGKPWTCPECSEELTTLQKGAHVLKHRREAVKAEG